jgi:hypothetical protein
MVIRIKLKYVMRAKRDLYTIEVAITKSMKLSAPFFSVFARPCGMVLYFNLAFQGGWQDFGGILMMSSKIWLKELGCLA